MNKTDTQLTQDIENELRWDPKVNAAQIGVVVDWGRRQRCVGRAGSDRGHRSHEDVDVAEQPVTPSAAMFKHILVPTDFGEASERALDVAMSLAEKFEAQVTMLNASWCPPTIYSPYALGLYWPTDLITTAAKEELERELVKARARYAKIDGLVVTSEPCQAILKVAQERGSDMIVMGTHGRHGLSRVLLGSVAEKIVRLSPIPVLTVSGKSDEEAKTKALAG